MKLLIGEKLNSFLLDGNEAGTEKLGSFEFKVFIAHCQWYEVIRAHCIGSLIV